MDAALELLKLGFVGLVAGFFTSFVANRDYRYRKWWELRVAAYQAVIEALSDMYHSYDSFLTAEIRQNEIPPERKGELDKLLSDGYARVRKAADTGSFLFSKDAAVALEAYRKSRDRDHDSYVEYLDDGCAEVKKCLNALVECSKKDLQLQSRFATWFSRFDGKDT